MIILDTNIISELLCPAPAPEVGAWLAGQNGADVFLTVISEAELRYGVAILAQGKRRDALGIVMDNILTVDFQGRILPFDSMAAREYAKTASMRRAAGKPISHFDCQIAAIARAHNASVATRNTSDFEGCGIEVIDPWRKGAGK